MRRLAVEEEYGPPASPLAWPKRGELKVPMGVATLTLLKMLRPATLNVGFQRLLEGAPRTIAPPRHPSPPPPRGPPSPGPPGPRPHLLPDPGAPGPARDASSVFAH